MKGKKQKPTIGRITAADVREWQSFGSGRAVA
jgi:hypothetical protein